MSVLDIVGGFERCSEMGLRGVPSKSSGVKETIRLAMLWAEIDLSLCAGCRNEDAL